MGNAPSPQGRVMHIPSDLAHQQCICLVDSLEVGAPRVLVTALLILFLVGRRWNVHARVLHA
eukprot:4980099-Heterocapsa_arctica.AAC.1